MINNRNQCPDGYIMSSNGNCQLMDELNWERDHGGRGPDNRDPFNMGRARMRRFRRSRGSQSGRAPGTGRFQTGGGIGMTRRHPNQGTQLPTIPNENPPGTREFMSCNNCIDGCLDDFTSCMGCDSYPKHGCSCIYMDWGWDSGWCCTGNLNDTSGCMNNCSTICLSEQGRMGGQGYTGERGGGTGRLGRKGGRIRRRR